MGKTLSLLSTAHIVKGILGLLFLQAFLIYLCSILIGLSQRVHESDWLIDHLLTSRGVLWAESEVNPTISLK